MEIFKKHFLSHSRRGAQLKQQELKILQLLEDKFINKPTIDHYPFSKIISTESCTMHEDCYTITMIYCGIDAIQNAHLVKEQKNIQPINLHNTVECIINNLCNLRIKYNDYNPGNVCINKNGYISLIDFGIAGRRDSEWIKDYYKKPNLNHLKNKLYNAVDCTESEHFMEKVLNMITPNPRQQPGVIHEQLIFNDRNNNNTRINMHKLKRLPIYFSPWNMLYMF